MLGRGFVIETPEKPGAVPTTGEVPEASLRVFGPTEPEVSVYLILNPAVGTSSIWLSAGVSALDIEWTNPLPLAMLL